MTGQGFGGGHGAWEAGQDGGGSSDSHGSARTSLTHPLRVDPVTAPESVPESAGVIGMTLCPGKKGKALYGPRWDRDLALDIEVLRRWGAAVVVTLVETEELDLLRVPGLGAAVVAAGMDWVHLPIPDLQAPGEEFRRGWIRRGPELHRVLSDGGKVVLHCRGGLGRTGTVAALLLMECGVPAQQAIEQVRLARPGAIETREQLDYLRREGRHLAV